MYLQQAAQTTTTQQQQQQQQQQQRYHLSDLFSSHFALQLCLLQQLCLHDGPNYRIVRAFLAFLLLLDQEQRHLCNRALFAQKFLFALIAKLALAPRYTPAAGPSSL